MSLRLTRFEWEANPADLGTNLSKEKFTTLKTDSLHKHTRKLKHILAQTNQENNQQHVIPFVGTSYCALPLVSP